jgi:hypothetical protein
LLRWDPHVATSVLVDEHIPDDHQPGRHCRRCSRLSSEWSRFPDRAVTLYKPCVRAVDAGLEHEDREALDRLSSLADTVGRGRGEAIQAYLSCDGNEGLAIDFLSDLLGAEPYFVEE